MGTNCWCAKTEGMIVVEQIKNKKKLSSFPLEDDSCIELVLPVHLTRLCHWR